MRLERQGLDTNTTPDVPAGAGYVLITHGAVSVRLSALNVCRRFRCYPGRIKTWYMKPGLLKEVHFRAIVCREQQSEALVVTDLGPASSRSAGDLGKVPGQLQVDAVLHAFTCRW